jgi:thermolysin metallopeptidase-like protein
MSLRDRRVNGPSVCSIIPPFMLEAIARNGTPRQREMARQTLSMDVAVRARRLARPLAVLPQIEVLAAAAHKNRLIHTANHTFAVPGTLIRSEGQGPSGEVAVDEAYDGLGATFDLYWDIYQRNSLDNNGRDLLATVHYGVEYNNAFWDGQQMVFGDGDPSIFNRFTIAIDVIGHELTHGVTGARLVYQDQSGALNESVSDVFGSLVKQRTLGQTADQADWLIGAGMFAPGINGIALRSMRAPGTAFQDPVFVNELRPDGKDPQPDHMSRFVHVGPNQDHGGVHINSGIPNRAFFLTATALGGNAWDKAGHIWYKTLFDSGLSLNAQFQDFASITARVANALYGSSVRNAVVQAWHEVGIGGDAVHIERSKRFNAPKAVGSPSGIVFPALGVNNVVYRDSDGRLHELWEKAADVGTSNLTQLANNATRTTGDPTSYIDTTQNLEVALYRGSDGHVHSLYWSTGAVGHDALSQAAGAPGTAGNPAGFVQKDGTNVVVYRTGNRHLHSLWWTGTNTPGTEDLTGSHPPAGGDPVPYINTITGENIVAYRGTDGHIHTIYWTTGAVGHDDLSGVAGSPNAAANATGDPVAYYTSHNDTHQVTYRSQDGHIHELWWVGVAPVQHRDLTAEAGASKADSGPAAYYNPGNGTKHVIYRSADGHLHELWWFASGGVPARVDVTNAAFAPTATDRPAAFLVAGPNTQHIVYRGNDGNIHEIRWI